MIDNNFFKGYFQALNTVQENIDHLINNVSNYEKQLVLEQVKSHVCQLRSSYEQFIRDLNKRSSVDSENTILVESKSGQLLPQSGQILPQSGQQMSQLEKKKD